KQLFQATTNSKHCQLELYADAGHTDVKQMPDYIKRSYKPFMKAVWRIQNPDQTNLQPPILVTDHGKRRTSSVYECTEQQIQHVQSTNLSSCSCFH
ncbi:unnamed protein product, partial [Adineta steineri]